MLWKVTLICHPIWYYLNQPVFSKEALSVWHPHLFWYAYRVQLLETCWKKETNVKDLQT